MPYNTFHETFIPSLCKLIGARTYVEIGLMFGDTMRNVATDCPDCECLGVDVNMSRVKALPERVQLFHKTSAEFWSTDAEGRLFDMIFIDGDHTYDGVRSDLDAALEHVAPDGVILLHDTNPDHPSKTGRLECGDCWRIPKEVYDMGIEAVTLPYHPGLTIIRNRKSWELPPS